MSNCVRSCEQRCERQYDHYLDCDRVMSLLEIVSTLTTLSVIASAICAATPTPTDDLFMSKYIYPVIEALALNVGKAKD